MRTIMGSGRRRPGEGPFLGLRRGAGATLQEQLAARVRRAILDGELAAGAALPPIRRLAASLGVARNTVELAYARLRAEGYVDAAARRGWFVRDVLPDAPLPVDVPARTPAPLALPAGARRWLAAAAPVLGGEAALRTELDPALFPAREWSRCAGAARRAAASLRGRYLDPAGLPALRAALAAWLRAHRGVRAEPEQVLLTHGAIHALHVALLGLVPRSGTVWMEDPGYPRARALARAHGARLRLLPVDAEGARLPARGARGALAVLTPSRAFPTGAALSLDRRLAALELAARSGMWLLEDDYDSELRYAGPGLPALQGLPGGERVLYAGTFAKALSPALGVGCLVVPAALVEPLRAVLALTARPPAAELQLALARFLESGGYDRHLRRLRAAFAERRAALLAPLEAAGWRAAGSPGGLHVTLPLPRDRRDRDAAARLAAEGIAAEALSRFAARARVNGLVLSFAAAGERELRRVGERVAALLGPSGG